MTKVGFTGPYADVNFGDYAMLINNIAALGLSEATLFSYNDGFLRRVVGDYFPTMPTRITGVSLEPLSDAHGLLERPLTGVEVLDLLANESELREAIAPLDVLVVNGGGYLNELWARPHRQMRLLQILAPALLAAEMGKRVVFSANGIGPFGPSLDAVANLLAGMQEATMYLRDQLYSPMWARRLGISDSRVRHAPDDLLLIERSLLERPPRISVSPPRRYVVVETYQPSEELRDNVARWEQFVTRMDTVYNRDVVFLPLNLGDGGTDQAMLLNEAIGIPWVDIREHGYLPLEDAAAVIGGADLVISGRYHALVLALAARTPVISVLREVAGDLGYYYSKNAGALRVARPTARVRELDYLVTSTEAAFARAERSFDDVRRQQLDDAATEDQAGDRLITLRQQLVDDILGGSR